MPNHFIVTIGQDPPYPCEYDAETNTLTAELPAENPIDQSRNVTIQQNSGNTLHQQIWANAMAHLNAEGVFDVPAPLTPPGASRIRDEDLEAENEVGEFIEGMYSRASVDEAQEIGDRNAIMAEVVGSPAVAKLLVKSEEEIALLQAELGVLQDSRQTSPDTVIAVQRVIINQMHSLYAVAVEDDEKMLAVMQRLLEDGEAVYNDWRGENDKPR